MVMNSLDGFCPLCGYIGGFVGDVCPECGKGKITSLDEGLDDFERNVALPSKKVPEDDFDDEPDDDDLKGLEEDLDLDDDDLESSTLSLEDLEDAESDFEDKPGRGLADPDYVDENIDADEDLA